MNESQQQEWNATFGVHSTFVHELRKLQYKAYSLYVHHGSAAVALNIDDPALRSETLGHLFIDFNNQIARALRYTLWHFGAFLPPGVATDVEEMVKKLKAFTALEKAVVHDFVLCHLNQRVY